MVERRAVQISYQLWMGWITHGSIIAMAQCVEGIPEGAHIFGMFSQDYQAVANGGIPADMVFVIEGENWPTPASEYTIGAPWGETYPLFNPVFKLTECRTCKHRHPENRTLCAKTGCQIGDTFGCHRYEPRSDE